MSYAPKSAFEPPYAKIVGRLIDRRLELEMTQAALGEAFGQNQSFISRIERRQRRIDVYEFVLLCRILRLDPGSTLENLD